MVSPSRFWLNGEDAVPPISVCKLNAEQDGLYKPLLARTMCGWSLRTYYRVTGNWPHFRNQPPETLNFERRMAAFGWFPNPMYALGPRPAVRLPAVVLELCRSDLVKGNKSESLCLNSEMKSVLQVLTFALAQSRFRVAAAKPK